MLYKLFGGLVGAFLWLCRVPASTLMLMGGNNESPNLGYHALVSGMMSDVEADCIVSRLSRCGVCASGKLARLWRAFFVACGQLCLASRLAGSWGFSVALSSASLNDHADGWRCKLYAFYFNAQLSKYRL